MATLPFDELNKRPGGGVAKKSSKAIPYKDYFGVMGLSKNEVALRLDLADEIEEAILFLYALKSEGATDSVKANETFSELLIGVSKYGEIDDYLEEMTKQYADDLTKAGEVTEENQKDQAMFLAEDMANAYANYFEYQTAKKSGKTKKVWVTENDDRVRPSHVEEEGVTVGIDDTFNVNGSIMRFPKDTYYGASDEEIMRCRCHVVYK